MSDSSQFGELRDSDDGQAAIDHELAVAWEAELERITAQLGTEVAETAEQLANED